MTISPKFAGVFSGAPGSSELDDACRAFEAAGSPAPSIIWSPSTAQMLNPLIERFAKFCANLCRENGCIYAEDVHLRDFGSLAEWMMILRIDRKMSTFVYAHYGHGIAEHFGRDMSGRTTDQFGGHISNFFEAVYSEVARRNEWVLTEHEPPRQVFVCSWRRLLIPLFANERVVSGFLAINVPENPLRTGLDLVPEPIFVLDASTRIRYANSFALKLFNHASGEMNDRPFQDVTTINLKPPNAPEEMFANGVIENEIRQVCFSATLKDDFVISVSGALHSGRAYYIVMLRLLVSK